MTDSAQTTIYEPSATDSRVVAALAAQKRLEQVMLAHDYKAIEGLMAPDLLVNAPVNRVANRDNVIGRIKANQISYEPNVVRNIEYAGSEDLHVLARALAAVDATPANGTRTKN